VLNLAGWAFIVWRRPFEVGDRVEIGTYKGDVVDIGAFGFTLLEVGNWVNAEQSSGRTVRVPNGRIFTEAVANYTHGFDFIWAELPVVVTFESDWEKAKRILQQVLEEQTAEAVKDAEQQLRQANEHMMVQYSRLSPTVYTRVVDSGIDLTLRFICPPRSRRDVEQAIWEATLRAFCRVRRYRFRLSDAADLQPRVGGQTRDAGDADRSRRQ
jgi:small-conductance mechanosensitive channel